MGNVQDARREMTKTKEQLEEEKKISLSIRIKPLDLDAMDGDQLNNKATELWDTIVRLETEKYDLEERQKRQDYDVSNKYFVIIVYNPQKGTICYLLCIEVVWVNKNIIWSSFAIVSEHFYSRTIILVPHG